MINSRNTDQTVESTTLIDKIIAIAIYIIAVLIVGFGLMSAGDPEWIEKLAAEDREYEAKIKMSRGIRFSQEGENEKAVDELKRALVIMPGLPEIHTNLGVIYKQMGLYEKAEAEFLESLRLSPPDSSNIYGNLVDIYNQLDNKEKELEYFHLAISKNQYLIDKNMKKGSFFLNQGQWDSAAFYFQSALNKRKKMDVYYHDMFVKSKIQHSEKESIVNEIETKLKNGISPGDMEIYDSEIFSILLSMDKGYAVNFNKLGYALARMNKLKKAEDHFRSAIGIWPGYPDANDNLVYIQNKLSERENDDSTQKANFFDSGNNDKQ